MQSRMTLRVHSGHRISDEIVIRVLTPRGACGMSLANRRTTVRSPRLTLHDFVPYRIAVLARGISVSLGRKYRNLGITIPEWRLIAHLAEVGTCSSGEICARTSMDKAKVNRAVMRLVAAGLVLADTAARD